MRNTNFVKTPNFGACGIPKNRQKIAVFKMLSHSEFDGVLSVPEMCEVCKFYHPLQPVETESQWKRTLYMVVAQWKLGSS